MSANQITQIELFEHFSKHGNSYRQGEFILKSRTLDMYTQIVDAMVTDSGWMAISGRIGSGKSYLIREIYTDLLSRDKKLRIVNIINPDRQGLNIGMIMRTIVRTIGEELSGNDSPKTHPDALAIQVQNLFKYASTQNIRIIIHIDEAQEMNMNTIKALKRLREFSFLDRNQQVAVVLVGQPALAGKLSRDEEVGKRCRLFPFSYTLSELSDIAYHKSNQMLDKAVCMEIARKLDTPLKIDRAISDAYQKAYLADKAQITIDDIEFPTEEAVTVTKKRGRKSQLAYDHEAGISLLQKLNGENRQSKTA